MLQIKYIKCVSIVIRNFTVCCFKSDFLKKNFAGINFCGLDKSKHFAGTNFRDFVRKPQKLVPLRYILFFRNILFTLGSVWNATLNLNFCISVFGSIFGIQGMKKFEHQREGIKSNWSSSGESKHTKECRGCFDWLHSKTLD